MEMRYTLCHCLSVYLLFDTMNLSLLAVLHVDLLGFKLLRRSFGVPIISASLHHFL